MASAMQELMDMKIWMLWQMVNRSKWQTDKETFFGWRRSNRN